MFSKLILSGLLLFIQSEIGSELMVEFGIDFEPAVNVVHEPVQNFDFTIPPDQLPPPRIPQGVDFDFEEEAREIHEKLFSASPLAIIESDLAAESIPPETTRLVLTTQAVTEKSLDFAVCLEKLEYLEITHCPITSAGIRKVEHFKALKTLNLTGSQIDDQVADSINSLPQLQLLVLSKTRVTNTCLARLQGHPNLKTIRLSETQIDDEGIPHLKKFTNLRDISARDLNLTDRALLPLSEIRELRFLDLSGTKVGQDLSPFAKFVNLQFLDLNRTRIVPTELRHLEQTPRLLQLSLIDADIDDRAIPYLTRLRFPYGLSVKGSHISPSGLQSLRQALPFYQYDIDTESDDCGESCIFERAGWVETESGSVYSAAKLTSAEAKEDELSELADPDQVTSDTNSP